MDFNKYEVFDSLYQEEIQKNNKLREENDKLKIQIEELTAKNRALIIKVNDNEVRKEKIYLLKKLIKDRIEIFDREILELKKNKDNLYFSVSGRRFEAKTINAALNEAFPGENNA